jgi:hypothetical protein
MPNFVGLMECANTYGFGCLAVPPGLFVTLLFLGCALLGWLLASQDYKRLMHRFRWGFGIGASMMASAFLAIVAFFVFDPDAVLGVEDSAVVNAIWIAAINAFGLGFLMLAGALGLRLGAAVAKRIGGRPA